MLEGKLIAAGFAAAKYEVRELINDDCLTVLSDLPDASVQLAILDLPYQIIGCDWDRRLDLDRLWTELRRVLTPNGTVAAFGVQPFTTDLILSARDLFKYSLVWRKNRPTNWVHAANRPLSEHEDIVIFSKGYAQHEKQTANRMVYNPQGLVDIGVMARRTNKSRHIDVRGGENVEPRRTFTGYPRSVLDFAKDGREHPTQKPVALLEWLIRTYSDDPDANGIRDIVIDPTAGSGSTAVAAIAADRDFFCVERDPAYFGIMAERVKKALAVDLDISPE